MLARRWGARVQVRKSCTAGLLSSSWMFWGIRRTFKANSRERAPRPVLFPGGADSLFSSQVPLGDGRGSTLHISIKGDGAGGGGGRKEVRKKPNGIPPAHLSAPSAGSDGGDGWQPGNCPFKETLASRRGGSRRAPDSALQAPWSGD